MENYNKFIESLSVRFMSIRNINILQPLTVENYYDVENVLIFVHKGEVKFGEKKEVVGIDEILFVPGGKMVGLTYGSGDAIDLSNNDFINNKEKYFQTRKNYQTASEQENITLINFEAKVFDTINFFASLDIPAFAIKMNSNLNSLIKLILQEAYLDLPGKERVVKLETDRLVVELIRHILNKGLFVEQLATNSTYFKDPRLINLFSFIKKNLREDLSNKVLANVANVSEDYVGQYFKMLTSINPQDYIEYQRMEMAVNMLRTTKQSIRNIGIEVGYKDTAYFCRRFKMMFGIPAGKMRRRATLMNV